MFQGLEKIGQFNDLLRVLNEHLDRTRRLLVFDVDYRVEVFRIGEDRKQESVAEFPTITQAVAWALDQPMTEKARDDGT